MDEFGLINIACPDLSGNGRFYSLSRINFGKPEIARMLSPDNYVQAPDFTQNFNRYSYCLNNPLKYTDPTGNNYVSDMYHGNNGGGDYFTGWGNYNLSRHLGNHLNGFANSGDQGMFAGANSRANFYFGWANLFYKGVTKTSFGDYYSNGGKYELNGSGVFHYSGMSAKFYADYLNGKGGYLRNNLLGLPWDAGRGNSGSGLMFDDPPDGVGQDGGDVIDGIATIGFTGTLSAGVIGGSFEIGLAFDGKNYSLYGTLEHAVGVDISLGAIVNYHAPNQGSLNFSDINGWSETYNGAAFIFDGTYGGNSYNSGLYPSNYSDYHNSYTTYGFGVSYGSPIGITRNKGYTWTFFEF